MVWGVQHTGLNMVPINFVLIPLVAKPFPPQWLILTVACTVLIKQSSLLIINICTEIRQEGLWWSIICLSFIGAGRRRCVRQIQNKHTFDADLITIWSLGKRSVYSGAIIFKRWIKWGHVCSGRLWEPFCNGEHVKTKRFWKSTCASLYVKVFWYCNS